jgi:hypothetical protein
MALIQINAVAGDLRSPVRHEEARRRIRAMIRLSCATRALRLGLAMLAAATGHEFARLGSAEAQTAAAPNTLVVDDFNTGLADQWEVRGGTWSVENGRLVGRGFPDKEVGACGQPVPSSTSLIRNLQASDVHVVLDMKSLVRYDKYLVLRADSKGNRVELNFRSGWSDLVIEEIDNCVLRALADPFPLPVSSVGDTQRVEAILIGSRLRVLVDNVLVVDRVLDLPQRAGRVGVGVISDGYGPGTTAFDNVRVLYAVVDADGDGKIDGDGVTATRDRCPGTVLPEKVPTSTLGTGRFANTDRDLALETKPAPAGPGEPGFTLLDTHGCSCEQIIAARGLGTDQKRFGCTRGTIRGFISQPNRK